MGKFKYLILSALLTLSMCFQSLASTATSSDALIMTTDELYIDTADLTTTDVLNSEVIYPEGYDYFVIFRGSSSSSTYYAAFFKESDIGTGKSYSTGLLTWDYTGYTFKSNTFEDSVNFLYAEDKTTFETYTGASISTKREYMIATSYTFIDESGNVIFKPSDWIDGARVEIELDSGDDTTPDTGGDTGDDTGGDTGGDTGDDTGGDTTTDTGYDDSNLLGKLKAWFQNMVDSIIDMRDKIVNAINTMIGSIQSSIADLGNAIIERINTFITTVSDAITSVYNELVALPDKIAEMFLIDFSIVGDKIDELKGNFKIIDELKGLWEHFRSTIKTQTETTPTLTVTVPEKYGGGTYQIMSMEPFEPYREDIQTGVGAFLLINYFYLVFKQIPGIIQGGVAATEKAEAREAREKNRRAK